MKLTSIAAGIIVSILMTGCSSSAQEWSIIDTEQPYRDVEFKLTEGTWISLDISPSGETIIFDVLGDIYAMPASGGAAQVVHSGPAMQHSPRFSPDGQRIAFVSDADGADNVWTSNLDGSAPAQVSVETSLAVADPSWSADGQTLVVARMFDTADRLHASELVTYPASGGAAVQIVPMPINGENVHDAVYAPNGTELYFVEKISAPHASGVYVDANHKNLAIKRKNLSTENIDTIIGGFGGASTPVISPDGSKIAFVRRVKDQTMLFTYDLATRSQVPIFDELDRDGQADFLGQGTYYPRYAWFPEGDAIAIWAGGKILRIELASGEAKEIPFTLTARHRLTEPARFTQELAPETLQVKAISRIALSPDMKTLAFSALGRVWQQQLSDNNLMKLSETKNSQSEAAFSPDGKEVAFIEWNDTLGGSLKVKSANGEVETLFKSSGIVREPVFSPDGSVIIFQIAAGDDCLGGHKADPGVYWIPSSGGVATSLGVIGGNPRFTPDGARVYFTTESYTGGTLITTLESVGFDDGSHVVHLRTQDSDTSELKLSPDLKWIAYRHYQNYYVAPFQSNEGEGILDAPKGKKVDAAGGYELIWANDSKRVYWALGADIFSADIEKNSIHPEIFQSIDLRVPVDKPSGKTAFVGGRIITMQGDNVIENGTVVIDGNRIVSVGPAGDINIPANTHVIDASGKTLMPGLVDMHGHLDTCYYASSGLLPQQQASRYAALSFGVTTNYDPYTSELPTYGSAELTKSGGMVGPRNVDVGYVVYGRKRKYDPVYVPLETYSDAETIMDRKVALGGTVIKSYRQIQRKQRQMLVKAGREKGVMVDVEGESHFFNAITAVLDGNMNLQHNIPVENLYNDFIQLLASSNVAHTPTLIVLFGEMMGENYLYQSSRLWEDPRVDAYVQTTTSSYSPLAVPVGAPAYVRGMTGVQGVDELWDIGFRAAARSMKMLNDAGGLVNAGSHGQVYGLAMHWELQLLSEGGMSNIDVLKSGTINGARTLGLDEQIGSIEEGKLADILLLDRNPLLNIRNTETVSLTMVNGRAYDTVTMNEIGNYERPRNPFYWEVNDVPKHIKWKPTWGEE